MHVPSLGEPIPLDEHACSVALPKWEHVVGYEEGDPAVSSKLLCGYPRFVYHPYVVKLMDYATSLSTTHSNHGKKSECIILPSYAAAVRARDFIIKSCHFPKEALSCVDNCLNPSTTITNTTGNENQSTGNNSSNDVIPIVSLAEGIHAVLFPQETRIAVEAKSYWQHTGEVVSSRRAEVALKKLGIPFHRITNPNHLKANGNASHIVDNCTDENVLHQQYCEVSQQSYFCLHTAEMETGVTPPEFNVTTPKLVHNSNVVKDALRESIASIVHQSPNTVFLSPSGMSAIYTAIRTARNLHYTESHTNDCPAPEDHNVSKNGAKKIVVFGFPYLDTLKMAARPELSDGVEFFGHGHAQDLHQLEKLLHENALKNNGDAGVCALVTEFPSNPLLNCHDLQKLRSLADEYNFVLIVDDTIGNFANVNLLQSGIADVICTSLTKLFNGRGDAIGGSVIANECTAYGKRIRLHLQESHSELELYESDASAILYNSQDFLERSSAINATAEKLADWLKDHEDVKKVYYPKFIAQPDLYVKFMNPHVTANLHKPGYGGLLSLILHDNLCSKTFYDKLDCAKGPSLGTNFTLVCPYTLLAHYHELEFARSFNVQANLIRVAIGLEPLHVLKNIFTRALHGAKLSRLDSYRHLQRRVYSSSPSIGLHTRMGRSFHTTCRLFSRALPK